MIRELLDAMPSTTVPLIDERDTQPADRLSFFGTRMIDENLARMSDTHKTIDGTARAISRIYLGLFGLGTLAAIACLVKGIFTYDVGGGLAMVALAGLNAVTFYALFVLRPLDSLQRHAIYSSWLTVVVNSYWTRLTHLSQSISAEAEVKRATDDLIGDLTALLDKQTTLASKQAVRVNLGSYRRATGRDGQAWEVDEEPRQRSSPSTKNGSE